MLNSPPDRLPAAAGPTPVASGHAFRLVALKFALILLAGWFVFSPASHGDWLWDDDLEITQNPLLRDARRLARIWCEATSSDYFPLKSTVQWG